MKWLGLIQKYRSFLPVSNNTPVVTLYEGNTILLEAKTLGKGFPSPVRLFLKVEGLNPTGSFKDRGMTMAVSKAVEEGAQAVICASTGNTSASAAAYAARAGIPCFVLVPNKAVALGKLAQAVAHGARVLAIEGNFDEALRLVRKISERPEITLVNSVNPYRLEGQKTGAFEVCEQLGQAPNYLSIPVGNAGNISAYWKGFCEFYDGGLITQKPVLLGFQAEGSAPIVRGHAIERPETLATAIRIGNPASWELAEKARHESQGLIDSVTDEEILQAYHLLASQEGIFVEPASAASIAGVLKLANKGFFPEGASIVCVLTGNGLKDPDIAISSGAKLQTVPADLNSIEGVLLG